jgi:hypothetical protein
MPRAGNRGHPVEQARLADAGLAHQHHQRPLPGDRALKRRLEPLELGAPPDKGARIGVIRVARHFG